MTYLDILNDKEIVSYLNEIDNNNKHYFSHGTKHTQNVIDIVFKVGKLLQFNENEINTLSIGATLHDIGRIKGKLNHSQNGSLMAKNYLKNKIDDKEIELISSMILNHQESSIKSNVYDSIICFADKMDFTNKRLEDNYRERHGFKSELENILEIDFNIKDNVFIVLISTNKMISLDNLFLENKKWKKGIKKAPKKLAKALGLKYEIYFNNNLFICG